MKRRRLIFGRVKLPEAMLETPRGVSLHRTLGALQLTLLGVGAIIGTGIFVLTAAAAQKAGPGMLWSFVIAAAICAVASLCYAELASMIPVSGSAYTYTYAVMGELTAWMVGWALVLEYAVAGGAVSVGWSGYFMGLLRSATGFELPQWMASGPGWKLAGGIPTPDFSHGVINLPAAMVALLVTWLLMMGTTESARVNAVLVVIKITALTAFITLTLPVLNGTHFNPLIPNGWFGPSGHSGLGVFGAAASIFFAYVGFDAVSTAAEETKNPQRNVPIALFGSLAVCTIFYLLVAVGVIGAIGAQPVHLNPGDAIESGSASFKEACAIVKNAQALVCSDDALAHVLRSIGWQRAGDLLGLAANLTLPTVILMMLFGLTRIFFVMSRDGLLPARLAKIHPTWKTPYIVTLMTGIFVAIAAAFLPVGQLADLSNAGTLFAFLMVAICVLVLRINAPDRHRPFRVPFLWGFAPVATVGCIGLFWNLPIEAKWALPVWGAIGLTLYFTYGYRNSHIGRSGPCETHKNDTDSPSLRDSDAAP